MLHKNMFSFGARLSLTNWKNLLERYNDLNSKTEELQEYLSQLFNDCFPLVTVKMRASDPPWMTPVTKLLMDEKEKHYKRNHFKYIAAREAVRTHIRKSKKNFIQEKLYSATSPKDTWNVVKHLNNKRKAKSKLTTENAQKIFDEFNSVFLPEDVDEIWPLLRSGELDDSGGVTVEIFEEFEVFRMLTQFKKDVPGPDGLPGRILRKFAYELAEPLKLIFNESIRQGTFPECWKKANVIPVPKNEKDFRPISLLSNISKVFERLVLHKYILPSLGPRFDDSQYGFLPSPHAGTCTALTYLRNWSLTMLEQKGGYIRNLLVDYSKAFDKLSHKVIMERLKTETGLPTLLLNWCQSYLTNRKQRLLYNNNEYTNYADVTSGVPQGSVLGPIFFVVVMRSLKPVSDRSIMTKFADDVTVSHHVYSNEIDQIQSEMNHITEWSAENSLKLNTKKTYIFNVSFAKNVPESQLIVDGNILQSVEEVKLLGVTFCSDLKWKCHLDSILKKCKQGMYAVSILKQFGADAKSIWMAYSATVMCFITYCYPTFCDISDSALAPFEKIDKKMKMLCGGKYMTLKSLRARLDSTCERLARKAVQIGHHPLHQFCVERNATSMTLRKRQKFQPVPSKRAIARNSFPKFFNF